MTTLIVIPARWNSTRFPGKPLAVIAGRPLLARTVDLARKAMDSIADASLMVTTDDDRVAQLSASLGCDVVMTSPDLSSGTARILAAAEGRASTETHILNLQGDAPFLPEEAIVKVAGALEDGAQVATPVCRLNWDDLDALREHKRRSPFSGTTCVRDPDGRALWFSKQIIPAIRDEVDMRLQIPQSPVFRHLGLYGYRLEMLRRFDACPRGHYERLEGLEQLRFLEMGVPVTTVLVERQLIAMSGIDTPEDAALATRLIAADPGMR